MPWSLSGSSGVVISVVPTFEACGHDGGPSNASLSPSSLPRATSLGGLARRETRSLPRVDHNTFGEHDLRVAQTRRREFFRVHALRQAQIDRQARRLVRVRRFRCDRDRRFEMHQPFTAREPRGFPEVVMRQERAPHRRHVFILPRAPLFRDDFLRTTTRSRQRQERRRREARPATPHIIRDTSIAATIDVVCFFRGDAPQRDTDVHGFALRRVLDFLGDPVVPTRAHPRVQEHVQAAADTEPELSRNAMRRHEVEHRVARRPDTFRG